MAAVVLGAGPGQLPGDHALSPVDLSQDGALTVLTFDAPPLNLWDGDLGNGLRTALARVEADTPRALLIRAEGKVFTAGVDVQEFSGLTAESGGEKWRGLTDLVHRIEGLECPTVLAAHALCLTWGFELALACDLLVAAESAQFGLVEKTVALTPSMGGPQRLALRAGPARAKELVMTADLYDAQTMHAWGVLNRVLPDDGFDAAARAFARDLAEGPTRAHAATKRLIDEAMATGAPGADALVPEVGGALFDTEDTQGAIASFLENGPKHRYVYRGR